MHSTPIPTVLIEFGVSALALCIVSALQITFITRSHTPTVIAWNCSSNKNSLIRYFINIEGIRYCELGGVYDSDACFCDSHPTKFRAYAVPCRWILIKWTDQRMRWNNGDDDTDNGKLPVFSLLVFTLLIACFVHSGVFGRRYFLLFRFFCPFKYVAARQRRQHKKRCDFNWDII